jgi:hypothetical protein
MSLLAVEVDSLQGCSGQMQAMGRRVCVVSDAVQSAGRCCPVEISEDSRSGRYRGGSASGGADVA